MGEFDSQIITFAKLVLLSMVPFVLAAQGTMLGGRTGVFNVAQETVVAHQAKPFDVTPKRSYRDHHNMDKLSSSLSERKLGLLSSCGSASVIGIGTTRRCSSCHIARD